MNMNDIRERAKGMGLDSGSLPKKEMIRFIQEKEGHTPCFKTDQASCNQYDCCWRSDCQPGALIAISQTPWPWLYASSSAPRSPKDASPLKL
jgi:hypothetical protein